MGPDEDLIVLRNGLGPLALLDQRLLVEAVAEQEHDRGAHEEEEEEVGWKHAKGRGAENTQTEQGEHDAEIEGGELPPQALGLREYLVVNPQEEESDHETSDEAWNIAQLEERLRQDGMAFLHPGVDLCLTHAEGRVVAGVQ